MNEIQNSIKFGSDEYLRNIIFNINKILEERKKHPYELYLQVENNGFQFHHIAYLSDIKEVENHVSSFSNYKQPYNYYNVFIRNLEDNQICLIGKKNKSSLIEISESYFNLSSLFKS